MASTAKKQSETSTPETHQFGAETGKILKLMIHSLYANKDIFLRELISNASDACDKLRYEGQKNSALLKDHGDFMIQIEANEEANTLTITDNGIGMDKQDLIDNLGTIASSGTQKFIEHATGDKEQDVQLIGQFGVGFYSSFMVADSVTVISRKAGDTQAYQWHSEADGTFSIEEISQEKPAGTSITLHLKEEYKEFTDKFRLQHIIKTYSDHITFSVELTDSEGEITIVNEGSALWARPKNQISEEQYQEFYKHAAHLPDSPWLTLHNKVEGNLEFTNLLFIPSSRPFDLYHPDRETRVKLYVKKVFITENADLLPRHLRFVRGVVDSQDLPLNISRETLQHSSMLHKIRLNLTKKILSELKKKSEKSPEEYRKFWENFGPTLKEGLCEAGDTTREQLLEICRFQSVNSDGKWISLQDYLDNMQENQEHIYFFSSDSPEKAINSPQLEGFKKRGLDVLLLTDSVDDFWINVNHEHQGKELVSITRSGLNLDQKSSDDADNENAEEAKKEAKETADKAAEKHKPLIDFIKETLDGKILRAELSYRLTDSPVCLTVQEGAMDSRMERFLLSQNQLASAAPKILEINPDHALIRYLSQNIDSAEAKDLARTLFDLACILEGEPISDTGAFNKRFSHFLEKAVAG